MEQLSLTFDPSTIAADIQECFTPAFNFTKLNSANGRLAFTPGKVYWLPDEPMAMINQGWVIAVSEIAGCGKYGITGFTIQLKDGKELRFSNVGGKMRDGITAAIEAHKGDVVEEAPAAAPQEAPASQEAPAAAAAPAAPGIAGQAPAIEVDPADASANKVMAILAYFGILVLIPLFAAKESKFARFHANQGLILLIFSVVIFIAGSFIPGISAIIWLLNVAVAILAIIGIVHAAKGEAQELPLVGKIHII